MMVHRISDVHIIYSYGRVQWQHSNHLYFIEEVDSYFISGFNVLTGRWASADNISDVVPGRGFNTFTSSGLVNASDGHTIELRGLDPVRTVISATVF